MDARLFRRRYHTPGTLLDHHAYAAKRGESTIAWGALDRQPLSLQSDEVAAGKDRIAAGLAEDEYHDVHRWKFTPSSFSLLVQDLRELGFHDLVEVRHSATRGFEFFVTLGKAHGGAPRRDRLAMLRAAEAELAAPANADAVATVAGATTCSQSLVAMARGHVVRLLGRYRLGACALSAARAARSLSTAVRARSIPARMRGALRVTR